MQASVLLMIALNCAAGLTLASCGRSSQGKAQTQTSQDEAANRHSVTIEFDYDFGKTPSCAEKPAAKNCVRQFDVYDVSGQRSRLFSIPVPKGAVGLVKGIKGQSPERVFLPGTHFLAVTAETAQGVESDVTAARVQVVMKPKAASNR